MSGKLVRAALALLVAGLVDPAHAAVMIEASVPELAREAELVARGTVESVESRRSSDGRRIYTVAKLRVADTWKGEAQETVEIRVPGGTVDGISQIVQGMARFAPGEEVVVFLRRPGRGEATRAGPMHVVAEAQGKLTVRRDDAGNEVAAPDLDGIEVLRASGEPPIPAIEPVPVRVVDLKRQVKAAAE